MSNVRPISKEALKRLPVYLDYLKSLPQQTCKTISATQVAEALGFHNVQVRKDLAAVSSGGKPRVGYVIKDLVYELEDYLGYNRTDCAVLVGAGNLGKTLMAYTGFSRYNVEIIAAFDIDNAVVGTTINDKKVLPMDKLSGLCQRLNVKLGIITVPENAAQQVCNELVASGVEAIWNFAPIKLSVPRNVMIQNENIGSALAILTNHLLEKTAP